MSDDQVLKQLRTEAAEAASSNPPLHVLDTAVLGTLLGIGWLVGRLWYGTVFTAAFAGKGLVMYVLAVRHGYRKGVKKKLAPAQAQPAAPPQPTELLAGNPIHDAYQTPFGVPYGPNVQAYSEPA